MRKSKNRLHKEKFAEIKPIIDDINKRLLVDKLNIEHAKVIESVKNGVYEPDNAKNHALKFAEFLAEYFTPTQKHKGFWVEHGKLNIYTTEEAYQLWLGKK